MVDYPQNSFTRMMEAVAERNRIGGVASATPLPSVRSAELGQEIVSPEVAPLTFDERAELDALAIAAGVKDTSLGNVDPAMAGVQYQTLEEAIAASQGPEPPRQTVLEPGRGLYSRPGRVIGVNGQTPGRIPNFANVQSIDLARGVAIVDGMEFALDEEDVRSYKREVIVLVSRSITDKLNEAISLLDATSLDATEEKDGLDSATESAVQREPAGDRTESQE